MEAGAQIRYLTELAVEVERLDELRAHLTSGRPLRVKQGFDPTAPDIHLGHTITLEVLRRFQELGHLVIVIIGDYTARIGDPSGKLKTRPMLSAEEIEANAATYLLQVGKILDVSRIELRRNCEWLRPLTCADILKLTSCTTVSRMLERDTFQQRLQVGEPITVTELLYPLMQGYDSVAVQADVEIGGTDQLYNLLMGREVQRSFGQEPQVVMVWPMLVGTDGVRKMSKSEPEHAIGITAPPTEMFGKLMSIPDSALVDYYRLLLRTPADELEQLDKGLRDGAVNARDAKAYLAERVTEHFSSVQAAREAREEFDRVVREGQLPSEITTVTIAQGELEPDGIPLHRLIVRCGLAGSNSEAVRLVNQGAVELDGQRCDDGRGLIYARDGAILRVGKRRFARIRLTD